MHTNRLFLMSFLLGSTLVACGDDGGTKLVDAPKMIDAAAIDSPAMVACPPATVGAGAFGTMAAPMSGNFVTKTMAGNPFLGIGLLTSMDMKNAVTFVWPKPAAGFAAGTFVLATDPNAATPAAIAYYEGGLDPAMPMANAAHFLWASNGTLTISSVSKTGAAGAGENPNDVFVGTLSAVMFKEIDANGAIIPGGCTVSTGAISFGIKDPDGTTIPTPGGQPETLRDAHVELGVLSAAQ